MITLNKAKNMNDFEEIIKHIKRDVKVSKYVEEGYFVEYKNISCVFFRPTDKNKYYGVDGDSKYYRLFDEVNDYYSRNSNVSFKNAFIKLIHTIEKYANK